MKKYEQCEDCWWKDETDGAPCNTCVDEDPEDHILPPSNWKYEDPEGEWK